MQDNTPPIDNTGINARDGKSVYRWQGKSFTELPCPLDNKPKKRKHILYVIRRSVYFSKLIRRQNIKGNIGQMFLYSKGKCNSSLLGRFALVCFLSFTLINVLASEFLATQWYIGSCKLLYMGQCIKGV